MQVFLPYPSYEWSLRLLDTQRLLKQVVEAYQLIKTSLGLSVGHTHHPVRIPFHDRVGSLVEYTVAAERILFERAGIHTVAAPKAAYSLAAFRAAALGDDQPPLPASLAGLDLRADLGITPEWLGSVPPEDAVRVSTELPWMIGEPAFHLSHQFSLAAKRPDTYGPLFGLRARCAVVIAKKDEPIEHVWGDPDDPEVRTDAEPYAWPVTDADGTRWFQIGTKTERARYAHLFDADPDLRQPLLVTPSAATARLERDHPRVLAAYRARLAAYALDPTQELAREREHAEQLALRTMSWPAGVALPSERPSRE
jgi:Pyrimidine dimer DNA glycosylase